MITTTPSAEKTFLSVDEHRIAYTTAGNPAAPPLIMVHGWLSHAGVWRQTFDAFQATHYCVAIDLLGLAASDKPDTGDYSIMAQARRVLALADHLGLPRFTLIGHSMGGQTALVLASMLAPERVIKLVDVDGVATGRLCWYPRWVVLPRMRLAKDSPWLWELTRRMVQYPLFARFEFWSWFDQPPPFESWATDRQMAMQPEMHLSAYRCGQGILATDTSAHLSKITAPTLILFGKRDKVVPRSEGQIVKDRVPNARLILFDSCGHFPMMEQTTAYLDALRTFLEN
ncbi:MAG: alpha/beta hydrolase [Anaerolineae bacterium]|nr:alpha/beta hydrolase [Anaerolineae bacterium]